MELKRGRDDEDLLGTNGEVLRSSSKLLRRSSTTSKIRRLSGRTVKLLEDKVSFPTVSKCRLKQIKASIMESSICFRDDYERPDPRAVSKECNIGSYFDTQRPIYSESFVDLPKVEVGKQLDVLALLGDNLLRFGTSSKNIHSILPTSSQDLCDQNKGFQTNTGSSHVERIRPPVLRRCTNVVGVAAIDSTTSTAAGGMKQSVSMESTLNLKGKYVMICSVFVPLMWSSEDMYWVYHTALASHELARRDDFELVVVPMMREGFTRSLSAYQHFLSGFSCLAVPFQDSHRRELICSSLGFDGTLDSLVLDPSQKVLYHGQPQVFPFIGGAEHDCFPFTPEVEANFRWREGNCSLDELLGLSDTDVLYNIEYLAGGRLSEEGGRSITISELKQKVVGLYLHSSGRHVGRLKEVHEECRGKNQELEIVVVGYPLWDRVPPKLYDDLIIDKLASLKMRGWWFFPFNNTVCLRLERMRVFEDGEESLFIVDPSVEKHVDPYGMLIIRDFGMNSYPFTRRKLIDDEFQRKMGLRLDSLLPWDTVHAALGPKSVMHIPVAKLKGKIVVLYLYKDSQKALAGKLDAWYKRCIKGRHSNVEVVAVCIDVGSSWGTIDEEFMGRGWLVCSSNPTNAARLCKEYFHPRVNPCKSLIVFDDEDGRIISLNPTHILKWEDSPFIGDLREDICRRDFETAGYYYLFEG